MQEGPWRPHIPRHGTKRSKTSAVRAGGEFKRVHIKPDRGQKRGYRQFSYVTLQFPYFSLQSSLAGACVALMLAGAR